MIPKILPECFGAKSCGLARTEQLWKPAKKRQIVIKNNAKVNEYFPMRPKCRKKCKTSCYYSELSNKRAGWNKRAGGNFLRLWKKIRLKILQLTR